MRPNFTLFTDILIVKTAPSPQLTLTWTDTSMHKTFANTFLTRRNPKLAPNSTDICVSASQPHVLPFVSSTWKTTILFGLVYSIFMWCLWLARCPRGSQCAHAKCRSFTEASRVPLKTAGQRQVKTAGALAFTVQVVQIMRFTHLYSKNRISQISAQSKTLYHCTYIYRKVLCCVLFVVLCLLCLLNV